MNWDAIEHFFTEIVSNRITEGFEKLQKFFDMIIQLLNSMKE